VCAAWNSGSLKETNMKNEEGKYTKETALHRVRDAGAKVNLKRGVIMLPSDGVGIKVLGALDYLHKEWNFSVYQGGHR
jgi:hypothetical protein